MRENFYPKEVLTTETYKEKFKQLKKFSEEKKPSLDTEKFSTKRGRLVMHKGNFEDYSDHVNYITPIDSLNDELYEIVQKNQYDSEELFDLEKATWMNQMRIRINILKNTDSTATLGFTLYNLFVIIDHIISRNDRKEIYEEFNISRDDIDELAKTKGLQFVKDNLITLERYIAVLKEDTRKKEKTLLPPVLLEKIFEQTYTTLEVLENLKMDISELREETFRLANQIPYDTTIKVSDKLQSTLGKIPSDETETIEK